MVAVSTKVTGAQPAANPYDYQAIVIGAGVSGMYQLKRLLDLGVDTIVLDSNSDLGGTWYNNRYPGARFDSESYTYGYSFSKELLEEWDWKERFSAQPETLRYLNLVADKFGLREHMQFDCRVEKMIFDEANDIWELHLHDGRTITAQVVITALGALSTPTLPNIQGIDDFEGLSFHPHHWPHDLKDLAGLRVGVIGAGATAIQIIPEVAKQASRLTVFQRRPNWAAPLHNSPINAEEMDDIRSRYDDIFAACDRSPTAFEYVPDPRSFYDVSPEERRELWDRLYDEPGFGIWLSNFPETFTDETANAELSDYIAERIRDRVDDPRVAEKLIPKDHGFGIQRLPLETGYFETFNRDNVELVDLKETPIERVTSTGLRTSANEYEFDVIVYATGFNSFTGAYDSMEIYGVGGKKLDEIWASGLATYLGLFISEFPNMAMLGGPQIAVTNFPRSSELIVDWLTPVLEKFWSNDHSRFNATREAQGTWVEEVKNTYEGLLINKAQSWFTGYNSNVKGQEYGNTRYTVYATGRVEYANRLQEIASNNFEGVVFS